MDEAAKRKALRMITYGLYVIGVCRDGELNGFTADWLTQTSFDPPLVALAVKRDTTSHAMIEASGVFSVNVLESGQQELAAKFFRPLHRVGNKLGDVEFYLGKTGCPILREALGWFECEVIARFREGDHSVMIGQLVNAGVHRQGKPLALRETGWVYGG